MKALLDVHYGRETASAACLVFEDWQDDRPLEIIQSIQPVPGPYWAGSFFVRELPCLLAVLQKTSGTFETLVIDGYVHLKPENGKGLGMHLYESLACVPKVVGIAKNPLKIADRFLPVLRGKSKKPLYVSAQGCPLNLAQGWVQEMHGPYRLPTLLRLTDRAARTGPDKGCV